MADLRVPINENVRGIDDEAAEEVFAALSSESARTILAALEDGPATAPELAEQTDLTVQNVTYHLEKLAAADLVDSDGTRGAGNTEATVYTATSPVVVSTASKTSSRLRVGALGLAGGSLLSMICLPSVLELAVDPLQMARFVTVVVLYF